MGLTITGIQIDIVYTAAFCRLESRSTFPFKISRRISVKNRLTKLLPVNRLALIFVALAAMSMLLMNAHSTNCSFLNIMVNFNFIAIIAAVLLTLFGSIQIFMYKKKERLQNILCLVMVLLMCSVLVPFNTMAAIGLGHECL